MFKNPHALMIQGTTSDAGKSILVTALCRILARNQISSAPFKSQNMALNSAVTADGGEIGRAQAVQAQACYLQAHTLMNPVLLKPNSNVGSQVIVNGKSIGNMRADKYHGYKPALLKTVLKAFNELKNQYSAIIIEGAGSPAEINLREHDIANMGLAEAIDCPVVIVCDIDRGGVFAHLYGTYELLSESEKKRVIGFVINRFRGDKTLLESGLKWLENKTSVPVLAVIPYIENLHIEAEDSLSNQINNHSEASALRVAIISYPKMSNHTDFDVLRIHPQIICTFCKEPSELDNADLIILPGSKNVRNDLQWLIEKGWKKTLDKHLRYDGRLLGICGGFQMLGQMINDPQGVESLPGSSQGLAYLDMETQLKDNKVLTNVHGKHLQSDAKVCGYEIHAGVSTGEALQRPVFSLCSQANEEYSDGAISDDYQIMGTYVHGLFDEPACLQALLTWAGLENSQLMDYTHFKDKEIDRLADVVEAEISLDTLKKILSIESAGNTKTNNKTTNNGVI